MWRILMSNNLDELDAACKICHNCSLADTRTNVVFGVGNKNAEVMFIGEAPGQNEEINGVFITATFHPASLLRNPSQKPDAINDYLILSEKIKKICEKTY